MKKLLVFLDFDGTLTPIVGTPKKARLTAARKRFLARLARSDRLKLAVISGRQLSDLKKKFGLPGLYYAGNHGLEISGPKVRFVHPLAQRTRPWLTRVKRELHLALRGVKGVLVEDKGLSLSLHFRLVRPADQPKVIKIFNQVVRPLRKNKRVRVTEGKMVREVRPPVKWDKGEAVRWLMGKIPGGRDAFPVYIGDDVTDEDAFRALRAGGLTVRVGRAKGSAAQHFLKDIRQVYALLRLLALEI